MNKNDKEDDVFSMKSLTQTVSRQIFVFIGILSQSLHGEDYLNKQKFYSIIKPIIQPTGKHDSILSILIDNINLDNYSGTNFLNSIMEHGSKRIKKYALDHLKCLVMSGKDLAWNNITSLSANMTDFDLACIASDIIYILVERNASSELISFLFPVIEKILVYKKHLLYVLMKNENYFGFIQNHIQKEIANVSIKDLISSYSIQIEKEMGRIFPSEDSNNDSYYMTINLPSTDNQYHQMSEYFWLKQLPFNMNIIVMENFGQGNFNTIFANCSFEYYQDGRFYLIADLVSPTELITFNIQKDVIKFICNLGDKIIDQNARTILQGSMISFDNKDFKNLIKSSTSTSQKVSEQSVYKLEKEGFVIELEKINQQEYKLIKAFFYVKINPEK